MRGCVKVVVLALVAALNALVGPGAPGRSRRGQRRGPVRSRRATRSRARTPSPAPTRTIWDINGAGDSSIQGFATDISVNIGQRIDFKIKTDASAYTIDIYRIGWYQGLGARKIASVTPSASLPQNQPNCITDATTELYDCGNWAVSASWNVPATAVSGVYIAHLKRSNGDSSHITFIVRDDASTSDVVFQTADPTWQAYNTYGGSNFYQGGAHGRAYKLSYNRPVLHPRHGTRAATSSSAPSTPSCASSSATATTSSYMAGVDTDRRGNLHQEPQGLPLRRARRVLERRPARQRRGGARRRGQPAVPRRQRGLLAHALRAVGRRHAHGVPHPGDLQGDLGQREDRPQQPSGPAPGATRASPRPPTAAARRRTRSIGTMYMVNFSDLAMTVRQEEGKYRLWRNTSVSPA